MQELIDYWKIDMVIDTVPYRTLPGACQDDDRQSSLSIVFRKYSPLPGGLEFMPNHTYYVICELITVDWCRVR